MSRRRQVFVFAPTFAPRDAVSDQARHGAALARRWGHRAMVVAERWHPGFAGEVVPLERALAHGDDAAWIVHYSIWADGLPDILSCRGPRAIVYHNVTPPELLPAGPVARRCLEARRRLPAIAEGWDLAVADSEFNARDLCRAGFRDVQVVPLLLPRAPAPEPARREPMVLSLGRLAPSKGVDDTIKAFALLRRLHRPDATLEVVGSGAGWESYLTGLEALAARTGAGGVRFAGQVDDDERDHLYRRAGAFVLLSRHEGFAVPLVEAMRLATPIVALDAGAIGETLGGGGLLLPSADPRLVAEALAEVLGDEDLRTSLAEGARASAARFDPEIVTGRMTDTLGAFLRASGA